MEFEPNQLQLFVSLTVILIAAFVALVCDYLKYDNEKLRELVVELKVRRDEEQKYTLKVPAKGVEPSFAESRLKTAARQALSAPGTIGTAHNEFAPKALDHLTQPEAFRSDAAVPTESNVRIIVPAETLALGAPPERISMTDRAREAVLERAPDPQAPIESTAAGYAGGHVIDMKPNGSRKQDNMNIQSDDNADMMLSGDLSGSPTTTVFPPDSDPLQDAPVVVTLSETVKGEDGQAPREFSVISTPEPASPEPAMPDPSATALKKDWNSILSRRRSSQQSTPPVSFAGPVEVREDLLEAVVAASSAMRSEANPGEVPAGFHDGYVLSRLLKSQRPVSGLVVSIGVNSKVANSELPPDAVRSLVESLMGPRDFACQVGTDEFLLIYPNETGASAQRRLGHISQRLWDFQLSSLGEASVLLSWGGVEVRSESIDEAFASASERMRETKRSRQDFALYRTMRKAV